MGAKFVKTYNIRAYEQWLRPYLDEGLRPADISPDVPLRRRPEVDDYVLNCAIARTPGGRLWCSWFGDEDGDGGVLLLAKSDDGGRSFDPPSFLIDAGFVDGTDLHRSVICGQLWTDPEGGLWVFYMQSLGYFDGRAGVWASRCADPDAANPSWTPPRRLADGCPMTKPIVLSDGRWMTVFTLWGREKIAIESNKHYVCGYNSSLYRELDGERLSYAYVSDDRGETWRRLGGCAPPVAERDFDEASLVEGRDGTIHMYMRTNAGYRSVSRSRDGGLSWSEPAPDKSLPAACSNFYLGKLDSGNWLLVANANPEQPGARTHMTAFISEDDGASWRGGLILDDRVTSYPDAVQAPDGQIVVSYDQERCGGEIALAFFREEDVAMGCPVSPDALFKRTAIATATRLAAREGYGPASGYIKFF